MPYNVDFRVPVSRSIYYPASEAPFGSLMMPLMGDSGFVCWRPGKAGEEPIKMVCEWTTYVALPLTGKSADEPSLVFPDPEILVDPATAYDPMDEGARGIGDLVTNGDMVMISAWTAEQKMLGFLLRAGASKAPRVAYRGWDIWVDGQHIFTKLS